LDNKVFDSNLKFVRVTGAGIVQSL